MTFDANQFMQQQYDGKLDTQFERCPLGEYTAMIGEITDKAFRVVDTKNGPRTIFEPPFVVQDEEVKTKLGRDTVSVFSEAIWLDIDDNGGLDMGKGKNVNLGKLRDALGQNNVDGWNFGMLSNSGPLMVRVDTQANTKDPENPYVKVTRFTAIR